MNSRRIADCAVMVLICASSVIAGQLAPPAGPISPQMKTLDEVEPRIPVGPMTTPGDADSFYKIIQSGSYYLTANVVGVVGKVGIEIAASDVTLDLSGYSLIGVPGSSSGILVPIAISRVEILNGVIRNWGDSGVEGFNATDSRVQSIRAANNGFFGINIGISSAVVDCIADTNAVHGIATPGPTLIARCTARANASNGIQVGSGSSIVACISNQNGSDGIWASDGSTVVNCSAVSNVNAGYRVLDGVIQSCVARANQGAGIVAWESTVRGCTADVNNEAGIIGVNDCFITENTCYANGIFGGAGVGIQANSSGNRFDGNTMTWNNVGLRALFDRNLIVRNSASNNIVINYDLSPGNSIGPIVDVIMSGDFSGWPWADSPWANFEY